MAPKTKNASTDGLGRAIMKRQARDARQINESGMYTTDADSTSRLQSVTQENDLVEFLNTAQLAGTEFTAERRNFKIIKASVSASQNPFLLSEQDEISTLKMQGENKQRLRVPRRPPWTKSTGHAQLERQEKDAFLQWRRDLAELQERDKFLLTPFERNLEVWRQLWRVIERSHLVVQIVDARNPLKFRCEDLEAYVKDVEGAEGEQGTGGGKRKNLLLINKADLLTAKQRRIWADYFESQGIFYAFYSAADATARQESLRATSATEELIPTPDPGSEKSKHGPRSEEDTSAHAESRMRDEDASSTISSEPSGSTLSASSDREEDSRFGEDNVVDEDPRAKVLSVLELEKLFVASAPESSEFHDASGKHPEKLVVGLVGYPNVGKSSTINSLLGEKKVSVSSTPGKTKHFQTINLSDQITLCDCPGLVFPQFATTKADLVCDGVLPIDQLREHTGPISLVVRRIPKKVLEATYGLNIKAPYAEDSSDDSISAGGLLVSYAVARGFTRSGQGNPDEARAARYILKDYVNAKLLFCHPPPTFSVDEFNRETRDSMLKRVVGKKRAPTTRVGKNADTFPPGGALDSSGHSPKPGQSQKSHIFDKQFFDEDGALSARPFTKGVGGKTQSVSRPILYPHHHSVADDGTPLAANDIQTMALMGNMGGRLPGKKGHKKMKRTKQRSGRGYD